MATVMSALELAQKCEALAKQYKTLYVMGCFGAPMTEKNRKRYSNNHSYNRKAARAKKINAAGEDTFGFDCVCMIKGLLWGWSGDSSKVYGGARYKSGGVPDCNADSMFRKCAEQSDDFSHIEVGEALWCTGHIGIYIGNGLAVECTPSWADGVQITACNRKIEGYKTRTWTKHGKLPYVSYESYSLERLRREVALVTEEGALPVLSTEENWVHILVHLVQKRLTCLGYQTGHPDGVFGPVTRLAVLSWQKAAGCPETGKMDASSWAALLEQEASGE